MKNVSIAEFPLQERRVDDFALFDYSQIHPFLSAEQVGVPEIKGMAASDCVDRAWQNLEVAIAEQSGKQYPGNLDAVEKVFRVRLPEQQTAGDRYKLIFPLAGFALFRARAEGEPVDAGTVNDYYRSVTTATIQAGKELVQHHKAAETTRNPSVHKNLHELRSITARGSVMSLLARAGVIALPTSPREGASNWTWSNHQVAVMQEEGRKKPVNVWHDRPESRVTGMLKVSGRYDLAAYARGVLLSRASADPNTTKVINNITQVDPMLVVTRLLSRDLAGATESLDTKILTTLGGHLIELLEDFPAYEK